MDEDDNIVSIGKERPLKPAFIPKHQTVSCYHKSIYVVQETRDCECQTCGATIDAFDWLFQSACSERNDFWTFQQLKKEIKELKEQKEQIQREVSNLKAQKRRL